MNKKKINDILNIDNIVETVIPKEQSDDAEIDSEYQYAKQNLHTVIDRGSDALEEMLMIAKQTEAPRAFEVVANLIKTVADANKDLLEIKNKQKTLKGEKESKKTITNNTMFVGSTAELQKMLKDMKNE